MRTTLDPTLDIVFKLLFSAPESREALTSLLTAVLRPARPISEVRVLNPWIPGTRVDDKGVVLDILVVLDDGTRINVEMQASRRPGLPVRALFYWSRAFTTQIERGEDYTCLRPVISVLFLDYVELDTPRFHSTFRLLEAEKHFPFSDALEIHVVELPKRQGPLAVTRQEDADLLAWSRFLGATSDEEVKEACMSNAAIAKANELLINLSATPSAQDLAQQRQRALDTYRIEMGALSAEVLAKGKVEGRVEGRAEGLADGLRTAVADLAESFGIELDPARREEIQRASLDELEALRARLKRERRWS